MTRMTDQSRSKRLKALTREIHDCLDQSIMEASSFDSLEGYGRFVGLQRAQGADVDDAPGRRLDEVGQGIHGGLGR